MVLVFLNWLTESNSINTNTRWSVVSHCRLVSGSTWLPFGSAKALSLTEACGRLMYLVHPCDTALRPHECLALRPVVGEIEREPAKWNAEIASTASRTGLRPN
jgi:hypothetical protein